MPEYANPKNQRGWSNGKVGGISISPTYLLRYMYVYRGIYRLNRLYAHMHPSILNPRPTYLATSAIFLSYCTFSLQTHILPHCAVCSLLPVLLSCEVDI